MFDRNSNLISAIGISALSLCTFNASAALLDRGNGFIYDTELDITWLADANYARTTGFTETGAMTWDQANDWVSQLNIGGYSDWRMPATSHRDASCTTTENFLGGAEIDYGYHCTGSEMGSLYYNSLGNIPAWDAKYYEWALEDENGNLVWQYNEGSGVTNIGDLFYNVMPGLPVDEFGNIVEDDEIAYWSGDYLREPGMEDFKWHFHFGGGDGWDGYQGIWTGEDENYTFLVRDGDVGLSSTGGGGGVSPVPVPASVWLFLSGVIGLVGVSRRKAA